MVTQAYFEDIEAQLLKELDRAEESIIVAVAWFTNEQLLNKLCEKCARGLSVELMILDDDINNTSAIDLSRLVSSGGKLYKVAKGDGGAIMHNKFCVIDLATVINGSYNWSYKARQNHENITVSSQANVLAHQFAKEFRRLKTQYFSEVDDVSEVDTGQVLKRLLVIKNLIALGETEDLPLHLAKLPSLHAELKLAAIIESLRTKRFGDALAAIEKFISAQNQVALYVDPEIEGLRMEAKALELQVAALENERTEMVGLLRRFHIRHTQELGSLIIKLLRLKVELAQSDEEREQASADKKQYEEGYKQQQSEVVYRLSDDEKEDLKQLYRQASKLCHPDMVDPQHHDEAAKWFIALKDAYEHNDRKKVAEIAERLQRGTAFGSMMDALSQLDRLRDWVIEYRNRVRDLLMEIQGIKEREEYQVVAAIRDWDAYFAELKTKLAKELDVIQHAGTRE